MKKKRMKQVTLTKADVFTPTEPRHRLFSDELTALMKKHEKELRPVELIAILSHTIGALLSLIAEIHIKNGAALSLIQRNIDVGNSRAEEILQGLKLLEHDTSVIDTQAPAKEEDNAV